jgi:hypothetical protein
VTRDRLERAHHVLARRVLVDARDERAVDLDGLRRELHQRLEAGVAHARVVKRELEAEAALGVARLAEHLVVLDRLLLRDLEDHVGGREAAAAERAAQRVGLEARVVDRRGADIEEELRIGRPSSLSRFR